jgi:hypothetical protein
MGFEETKWRTIKNGETRFSPNFNELIHVIGPKELLDEESNLTCFEALETLPEPTLLWDIFAILFSQISR